jgi:pilus assembly protein Flp/PilA
MTALLGFLGRLGRNEQGATAIEYTLLAGFIALAIILSVDSLGAQVLLIFGELDTEFEAALN